MDNEISWINDCSEWSAYSVPSDSGRGDYEVWISRHTGLVYCTCMHSQCRGKNDYFWTIIDGDSVNFCKHQERLFQTIRQILRPPDEDYE